MAIFESSFEGENDNFTAEFTGEIKAGDGEGTVETLHPQRGTKNAKFSASQAGSKAYAYKTIADQTEVYGRAYVQFSAFPSADTKRTMLLNLKDNADAIDACFLDIYNDSGTLKWRLTYGTDAGMVTAQYDGALQPPALNVYFCFEIYYKRATSNVASDGKVKLWVNGDLLINLSNIDNYDDVPKTDQFQVGNLYQNWAAALDVYADCCVVDSSHIGILASKRKLLRVGK